MYAHSSRYGSFLEEINQIENYSTNLSWCILLSTCARTSRSDDKRVEYYNRTIKEWIDTTSLPIFVIESSLYDFPDLPIEYKTNPRLHLATFDLSQPLASTSQYEARSILYALDHWKEEMESYTHVLKVTGRYVIPYIDSILEKVPDVDMIFQHHHTEKSYNTEIIGFRKTLIKEMIEPIIDLGLIEYHVASISKFYSWHRIDPVPNKYHVPRGGDGLVVDPL